MHTEIQLITRMLAASRRSADAAARQLATTAQGRELLRAISHLASLELHLRRDERVLAVMRLSPSETQAHVVGILPGNYSLVVSTGRLLWEHALTSADVIRPTQTEQRAAAQTEEFTPQASVAASLASGALHVSVFPGAESGTLVCHRTP